MWEYLIQRRYAVLVFLAGAACVYAAAIHVVGLAEFRQGSVLPFAVTFDLVLTIPGFYYFVLVRRAGLPLISVIPVFLACLLGARAVLPAGNRNFLEIAGIAGGAAEVFFVGYVIHRAGRAVRALNRESRDPVYVLRGLLRHMLGAHRLTDIAAAEAAMLHYAFFSWRSRPLEEQGRPFSCHRNSGWGSLLGVIGFFAAMEIVFVHLVLSRWSPPAAWCASILGAYGAVWLAGDYRALVLRPVVVEPERVRVRVGLRWEADLPMSAIARVWRPSALDPDPPRYLNAAVMRHPTVLIELTEDATARGLFGMHRRFRVLGLSVDEAATFIGLLERRPETGSDA